MGRISTRFALVVGAFALAFSGFVLYRTWSVTRNHMGTSVAHESELALEFDLAIQEYVREVIRPEMHTRLRPDEFVPEVMSASYVARLKEEQCMLRQLLEIHERHQKLVACEIHDSLTQPLTGALMSLDASRRDLQHGGEDGVPASLERARELLGETIHQSRRLMSGLRPPILDDLGPIEAIESLVMECEVLGTQKIECTHDVQFDRLSPMLETTIFRIVQECLRNAQRHSQSDRVRISLVQMENHLRIEVQDRGAGFDPEQVKPDRFGLESIRERSRLLGGEAVITSLPGQGALISVDLPLTDTEPPEA
jgi:signal transduction histidine kinase